METLCASYGRDQSITTRSVERIAAAIHASEKRLATHKTEESAARRPLKARERGLFKAAVLREGGARRSSVATDGDGVAAPRDCGLLGGRAEGGAGAHARREGVALHVLDYAGAALTTSPTRRGVWWRTGPARRLLVNAPVAGL